MRVVLDMTVARVIGSPHIEARLADDLFEWLCDGGDGDPPPAIESFDSIEVLRDERC